LGAPTAAGGCAAGAAEVFGEVWPPDNVGVKTSKSATRIVVDLTGARP
jgi:hypothetical protein